MRMARSRTVVPSAPSSPSGPAAGARGAASRANIQACTRLVGQGAADSNTCTGGQHQKFGLYDHGCHTFSARWRFSASADMMHVVRGLGTHYDLPTLYQAGVGMQLSAVSTALSTRAAETPTKRLQAHPSITVYWARIHRAVNHYSEVRSKVGTINEPNPPNLPPLDAV